MTSPGRRPQQRLFDLGLQPERTTLAWRRTVLASLAASIIAIRVLLPRFGVWAVVLAAAGVIGSLAIAIAAQHRSRRLYRSLADGRSGGAPPPSGTLMASTAVLVVAGGAVALTEVLLR